MVIEDFDRQNYLLNAHEKIRIKGETKNMRRSVMDSDIYKSKCQSANTFFSVFTATLAAEKQINTQTDKQPDINTDRQKDTHIERQTDEISMLSAFQVENYFRNKLLYFSHHRMKNKKQTWDPMIKPVELGFFFLL